MIETEQRGLVAMSFGISAAVMTLGGLAELIFGVKAERSSLEDIAKPLTAQDAEGQAGEQREPGGPEPGWPPPRRQRRFGAGYTTRHGR